MDNQLKIFALEYVKIHDDLLKEEKFAIGQFIMESSDDQVRFMLITGEVKDNLTKEDVNSIKELKFSPDPEGSWKGLGQAIAGPAGRSDPPRSPPTRRSVRCCPTRKRPRVDRSAAR